MKLRDLTAWLSTLFRTPATQPDDEEADTDCSCSSGCGSQKSVGGCPVHDPKGRAK